ncbi:unnamed protein product [Diamesa hyperborea]
MLDRAHDQIVGPLEEFRKNHIGGVKEKKKQHDKRTAKFCQAQEKTLNLSSKKPETVVVEADAQLGMIKRDYMQESLSYVLRIQEVQERIKFEFVEILLGFMNGWLVFYHLGHEVAEDAKEYMTDLQHKVQKTREGFAEFREIAQELKSKYMNFQLKPESEYTNQGYLYLMEKKAFTATWSKYYCTYKKQNKQFTMLQYNQQIPGRATTPEKLTLSSCTRCISDFEKRFCLDLQFEQRPNIVFTFQALSEKDRKVWLDAMDGKEPVYLTPGKSANQEEEYSLDDMGFAFVRKCIEVLEQRGLEEEGLYRVSGVGTKINKVLAMGLDVKKTETERLQFFTEDTHTEVLESKTIASALKQYLRKLKEPLMTYRYFNGFLAAAKQEQHLQRISDVHALVYRLPKNHFEMLDLVIRHLKAVSSKSNKNKMSIFNLGVVFGPTLLKATEDSLAAVLEIKFNNLVIEILIENYELIFKNKPGNTSDYIYLKSINHNTSSSTSSSASPPTTINNNGYNQAMYQQKQQLYQAINKYSRENTPTSGGGGGGGTTNLMRNTGGGGSGQLMTDSSNIYGAITTPLHNPPSQGHHKQLHHNILTSSDTNLSKLSLFDRIHSTSSSNESVCSSSSRDLNLSSHQPYHQQPPKTQQLRVRTLYACLAENDGELSFEPNQIITNVRRSNEPGWLEGTLNGKSGLIPENYVEILN